MPQASLFCLNCHAVAIWESIAKEAISYFAGVMVVILDRQLR